MAQGMRAASVVFPVCLAPKRKTGRPRTSALYGEGLRGLAGCSPSTLIFGENGVDVNQPTVFLPAACRRVMPTRSAAGNESWLEGPLGEPPGPVAPAVPGVFMRASGPRPSASCRGTCEPAHRGERHTDQTPLHPGIRWRCVAVEGSRAPPCPARVPAPGGVVVVGAGVDHGVGRVVVGEKPVVGARGPASPGRRRTAVCACRASRSAREARARPGVITPRSSAISGRGPSALLEGFEDAWPGRRHPPCRSRGGSPAGTVQYASKPRKWSMRVKSNRRSTRLACARSKIVKPLSCHRLPVVEGVAPELARRREVVGRDSGDDCWPSLGDRGRRLAASPTRPRCQGRRRWAGPR